MRPILKRSGRTRTAGKASGSPSPTKPSQRLTSPSGRRVTFSPFAKSRRRFAIANGDGSVQVTDGVSSGFDFSAGIEREKRRQERRKSEMSVLKALYKAAQQQRQGWLSFFEEELEVLQRVQVRVSRWLRILKNPLNPAAWRRKNPRIIRSRIRHPPPVEFDESDRQYSHSVNAPLIPTSSALLADSQYRYTIETDQSRPRLSCREDVDARLPTVLQLIPSHFGSLSTFLRRRGIPAAEDEEKLQAAVNSDLRGVSHRAPGLRVVQHS